MIKKLRLPLLVMLMVICAFSGVKATKAYKVYTTTTEANAETFILEAETKSYDIEASEFSVKGNLYTSIGKEVEVEGSTVSTGKDSQRQYIRVVITKKFEKDGKVLNNKYNDLGSLLELTLNSAWTKAAGESTPEREVYYLTAGGSKVAVVEPDSEFALIEGARLDGEALDYIVDTLEGEDTVTTAFGLHEATAVIEVEIEGIQVHNAKDAALDAWGVVPAIGFAPETTD